MPVELQYSWSIQLHVCICQLKWLLSFVTVSPSPQLLTCWSSIPIVYSVSFLFSNSLIAFGVVFAIFFLACLVGASQDTVYALYSHTFSRLPVATHSILQSVLYRTIHCMCGHTVGSRLSELQLSEHIS